MTNKKSSMTEKVIKNSVWSFLLSMFTKGGGLIFTLIIARFLLPESFGIYSLTISLAVIFMSLGNMGLNQTFTVFFSKALDKSKKQSNAYFNYLFKTKLLSTFLISLILFFSSEFLAEFFNASQMASLLKIASLYIFLFSLTGFFTSFFYIYKKVKFDFFKEVFFQSTRLFLMIMLFVYFPKEYYLIGIFSILVISSFVIFIYNIIKSKKLAPFIFSPSEASIDKKRVFSFLSYLAISGIFMIIFSDIDILMLGKLAGDFTSLGYYKASMALILGVSGIFTIAPILLPIFSSFKKKRMEHAAQKVMKYTFLLNIPAAFGMLILGRYFLRVFYGPEYIGGAIIISFLSLLIFSESTSSFLDTLFASREKPKFIMYSLLISTLVNIILNYALITYLMNFSFIWAATGAAIATLASRYLFMFSMMFYLKKELNISIKKEYLVKPLLASLLMAGVLSYFIQIISDMTFFLGMELIILGILVYFLSMFLMKGIVKEDFEVLKIIIPSFLKQKKV